MRNAPCRQRRRLRGLPIAAALLALAPAQASALGAVIGQPGDLAYVASERFAVSAGASQTTRWSQITVSGTAGGYVWLLPVSPGARLDLASDAWLDALDAATSPVILPPTTPGCVSGTDPCLIAPATSAASMKPLDAEIVTDLSALAILLSQAGYTIPATLEPPIAGTFATGGAVAALFYQSAVLPAHTVRIVDDTAPALAFGWSGSVYGDLSVTAFVIGSSTETAGTMPLSIDPLTVDWVGDAASNYTQARQALLDEWQGTRWLTESSMPGLFFSGVPIDATTSLPPVLEGYFTLAASYGDASGDPDACAAAASATSNDDGSYASLCPAGALGVAPGPDVCAPAAAAGVSVGPLTCGESASDAALAVSSLSPSQIWITRIEGIVTLESAADVPLEAASTSTLGTPISPLITAGGYLCDDQAAGGGGGGGGGGGSGDQGSTSGGSSSGADAASDVADGCSAGLGDGCDSDSSDDTDDDSSGCSSGSSDAGSDDCSGDADSGSCSTARTHRHHRSPASRILLACAAMAAIARRSGRRKQ